MPRLSTHPLLILTILAVLVVLRAQAPLRTSSTLAFDPRFGAVEAFRARDQANAAGVRWSRLVFAWSAIQPSGPRSWNAGYFPDRLLEAELASGRRVVGLLIGTPPWAGHGSPSSPPRGLDLPPEHSDNAWAAFARAMAERYRGRIDHWVIWNEPDIWDPASPLYTWSGSVEDFYQLQKVAYLAIKQANPAARVALPGLTYWWDVQQERPQYFERLLDVAARDEQAPANNWFFDAAVLHLYNQPDQLYTAPALYRDLMAARGLNKPIWINETNVAPWDDPANPLPRADFRATLDEQASYLVQAFAYGLAAGAEHLSVYPFFDSEAPPGTELMGLVRRDGSARPAYQALQTITRHFTAVRAGRLERDGDAVKIVLQRDIGQVTVAWSAAPHPAVVSIPATTPNALLVDKYGRETPVAPTDGAYRLSLDPATANTVNGDPSRYLIGGSPLLLVEPAW
jgi:hypothetical protein